jgi:1,4-alpha-glucan branching enzyme
MTEEFLTDFDLHLFGEGTFLRAYDKLGAHPVTLGGKPGVHFAVWAPNAARVSVVGDFNRWSSKTHPLKARANSGIWQLFVPDLAPGTTYKYEVFTHRPGLSLAKADPYGAFAELRPGTASVVWDVKRFAWTDREWMAARKRKDLLDQPMAIYEVHPGSWRRPGDHLFHDWRYLAGDLLPYVREMGFTHVELLPVGEHPLDDSWGYQPTGYFAATSRYGTPDDFAFFVNEAHRAGIGVLLDWVPAHFAKDAAGLGNFDGTHLYEHADPRQGEHRDWGTYVFNLGRPQVRSFLLSSALAWLDRFHIDGLRVDAVASMLYLDYSRNEGEWVANVHGGRENLEAVSFLKELNVVVHREHPGVLTIAEESTAWPGVTHPVKQGGLGFDLKWNMGWMNDMLAYMRVDPLGRPHHHKKLTFSLQYAHSERFLLPLSHDEVVHGKKSMLHKMPGDAAKQFANLRALYAYMYAHPGKKLLFMGNEIGQPWEWNFARTIAWPVLAQAEHAALQSFVRELNRVYVAEAPLWQVDFAWEGFDWIDHQDARQSVVSFLRKGKKASDWLVVVANLTPVPREGYRIGVPAQGPYRVVLNSDDLRWGGSGRPLGDAVAEAVPEHGRPASLALNLPGLSVLYLQPRKP